MPRATQDATRLRQAVVYGTITLYGRPFQGVPLAILLPRRGPTTPVSPRDMGLGSSVFARHYLRNHCLFSPPMVLRCFSSPRSPPLRDDRPSACRVAPFGYPGINGYLRLPRAFRSLSRPSSPPRAKASTVCPCLLSLTSYIRTG